MNFPSLPLVRPDVIAAAVAALAVGFSSGVLLPTSASSGVALDGMEALSSTNKDDKADLSYGSIRTTRWADTDRPVVTITDAATITKVLRRGLMDPGAGVVIRWEDTTYTEDTIGTLDVRIGVDNECGGTGYGIVGIGDKGILDTVPLPQLDHLVYYPPRCDAINESMLFHVVSQPVQLGEMRYIDADGKKQRRYVLGNGFEGVVLTPYDPKATLGYRYTPHHRTIVDRFRQDTSGSRELSSDNPLGDPRRDK